MKINGWILDLYESQWGVDIWIITEDEKRRLVSHPFPATMYAYGPREQLRALWRWLSQMPEAPSLARQERLDVFLKQVIPVVAVTVNNPTQMAPIFNRIKGRFPNLTYYDADLSVQARHAAASGSFPLARVECEADAAGEVENLNIQSSPWDLDPEPAPLRVMEIFPNGDPHRNPPDYLTVKYRDMQHRIPLTPGPDPAYWVGQYLARYDPDILLTDYGDTWLIDELLKRGEAGGITPAFNRADLPIKRIKEKSYFSYGMVLHRGQQLLLSGRVHIDRKNCMFFKDYGLEGIYETSRLTSIPIQQAARSSAGTGVSAMEMIEALRSGVLVPIAKAQVEDPRSIAELIQADRGGMVYQPLTGVHESVGEADFTSMYAMIFSRCNLSPESTPRKLNEPPGDEPQGLIPRTLEPLIKKRVLLKRRKLAVDKPRVLAQKNLLIVSFGYAGYVNARFGKIEIHETITSESREGILLAKESAEELGFEILHIYVDGLWMKKEGATRPEDFQPVLDEIERRTGLPIVLDGIFKWVVFLPARARGDVPVPNRYFGVFQDGSIKMRGIEARRRDTPQWISKTQIGLIRSMSRAGSLAELKLKLPELLALLKKALSDLERGLVPPEDLIITLRLSRELEKYHTLSPAARAAKQLLAEDKVLRPGQRVRLIYTLGEPDVWAWDRSETLDPAWVNIKMYRELMLRAGETIFNPLGVSNAELRQLANGCYQLPLFDYKRFEVNGPGASARVHNGLMSVPV